MRILAIAVSSLAALLAPMHFAHGQYRSRDRGAFTREDSPRSHPSRPAAAGAVGSDPFSSLERELLSLKVDLKLRADQLPAWAAFERDVQAAAEANRAERRRLLTLGEATPAPGALSLLGELADDAREEAAATAAARDHLKALHDMLDPAQRAMLDRRVVQSQTEPLGR